ncbi:hypothetical protein TRV_01814 [Trichophyton verrucosum HKI 0517]|uniref:Uncharacterized protein n=1 Tax=Trichophyton verrucosum (strain HKI 0517) TaxID=663202 RepID=D4D401_TRIVH|nr:uncharacterized protein TRV_01814 [Trichophyton verrucosum HKI 0517]EFE43429.1 hypothetical protein TRV_01814 [Trichophyton verrucosum HKI 0517]
MDLGMFSADMKRLYSRPPLGHSCREGVWDDPICAVLADIPSSLAVMESVMRMRKETKTEEERKCPCQLALTISLLFFLPPFFGRVRSENVHKARNYASMRLLSHELQKPWTALAMHLIPIFGCLFIYIVIFTCRCRSYDCLRAYSLSLRDVNIPIQVEEEKTQFFFMKPKYCSA